ncbi:MAG: HAMP domain-containing histidine kinase [Bacteroidetes bacterium]|nr:HAMP domain-containing histidine kinase [Bacteroidota bacterium]MBS1929902.1 HAMP domain-containing histidine kinase [Bacteroidota bacterium]
MKRLHWLATLMTITILGIAGFQAFWLKQNYDREKKNLKLKSEFAFVSTVQNLQASKLKLGKIFSDSTFPRRRVFINNNMSDSLDFNFGTKRNIATTIKIIQDKFKDSIIKKIESVKLKPGVAATFKGTFSHKRDSISPSEEISMIGSEGMDGKLMLRFLSDVDSLQDTLKVKEISSAYSDALKKQKLQVPFTVMRLDTAMNQFMGPSSNEVTIGFMHPVTYKMELGNTIPYLLKQIISPLLFSVFLVGVTILSFLLLYRSLLRQKKLAELKNEFISNITHELKTPIATVGVAIEALKNFNAIEDPQRTKEYLDISSNELQRLSLLVDKVLKLSMFEKKEIELKLEMLNLKDVVDEVVSSMRLQIEKYHAKVSVTHEGDLHLYADRLHLLSVVFNLLDNALKYSKSNPSIQVDLKGKDNDVEMSVTDNGIGIAAEYRDKLFEKFFRVPTGDTHNAKGYGLGLSYVAHVIQKHRGTITVESQPGIGSKFIITLPKQQS